MSAPFLEIKGLKKTFSLKPILRGVDLFLDQGERMALLGANGAGKTTLLRILAGLIKPGAGTARIGGWDIEQEAQQVRHLVGFVPRARHRTATAGRPDKTCGRACKRTLSRPAPTPGIGAGHITLAATALT